MSSESQKNSSVLSRLQKKQDTGYITICCDRAFLSQDSYHSHVAGLDEHTVNSCNDILLKTPVVKITKLPPSHPVMSKLISNRKRMVSLKRRLYHKHSGSRRTIRCHLCGLLIFGGNLKRHIKNAHVLKSQHKCRWCSCVYASRKAILLHITRAHPMEQKRCNWDADAQSKFEKSGKVKLSDQTEAGSTKKTYKKKSYKLKNKESDANRISKTDYKEETHECIFCGKIFNSKISFLQHLIVHIGEKPYKCEICEDDFATTNELSQHIDLWHPDSLRFKCDKCPGLFYNTQEKFENHVQLRHAATSVADYPSADTYNSDNSDKNDYEMKISNDTQNHNGDTKLKVSDVLKMKSIKVSNGYKCQICGKILKELAYYRAHRLLHTDVFPYACPKCGRKFRTRANCDSHAETSHVENGGFQCDLCPCKFASSFGLKCHTGIYHKKDDKRGKRWKVFIPENYSKKVKIKNGLYSKAVAETVKNENGYQCKLCGKTLASPFAYNGHMLIHTNELPHKCQQCPAKFRLTSTRDRHIKTNHVVNGAYRCYLCPCTFDLHRGLRRHLYCYHSGRRKSELKAKRAKIKRIQAETIDERSTSPEWEYEEPKETSDVNEDVSRTSPMESLETVEKAKPKSKKLAKKTENKEIVKVDSEDLHNIESIQMDNGLMCSLCGKILKNSFCFRQHRLVHSNLYPHKCYKCGQKFRRKVDRDKHLRVSHVLNGAFKCSKCPCTFAVLHSLKSHNNSMHKSTQLD